MLALINTQTNPKLFVCSKLKLPILRNYERQKKKKKIAQLLRVQIVSVSFFLLCFVLANLVLRSLEWFRCIEHVITARQEQ